MTPNLLLNSLLPNLKTGDRFFARYEDSSNNERVNILAQVQKVNKGRAKCWVENGYWTFNCDLRGIAEKGFLMDGFYKSHSGLVRVLDYTWTSYDYDEAMAQADRILRTIDVATDKDSIIKTIRPFQKLNASWMICE